MAGHYREVDCKLAGIDRKVLLNWLKRGEREQSGARVVFFVPKRVCFFFFCPN